MDTTIRLSALVTAIAATVGMLAGCANPGVVRLAPDTYMLSRTDKGGIFGNASALKAEVIAEANAFAEKQGKIAVALDSKETPLQVGRSFASFEYQFRVVDKDDPEARRVRLRPPPPNTVVKETVIDRGPAVAPVKRDVYTELTKLDDLRKRGILTDAEFEAQKKKLLAD